ncbi:WD40-repeat-containing domain protein [Flagelloscypha sp. PMI_526]|nr:WD40-repeat-containing domain protein [Flagelloscypha sp. PMI_526]
MPRNQTSGLALLSLDGGRWENLGPLTQIHIVEDVLNQYELDNGLEEGSARVPDVFDFVLGTGTGGLVACMLGPLKMSTNEAKKAYLRIYDSNFLAKLQPPERAEVLQREVENLLDSQIKDADTLMSTMLMADVGKLTPNFKFGVSAMAAADLSKPVLFRAYQGRGSSVRSTLLEAILASLSDGHVLLPISIGLDIPERFVSTTAVFCNPAESLLREVTGIFKSRDISVIVSIGSGRPDPPALIGQDDLANAISTVAASCHTVAENMQSRFSRHPGLFVRLDVDGFDFSTIFQPGEIIAHSRVYMDREEIRERVDGLVHSLTERPKRLKVTQISGLKLGIMEEVKYLGDSAQDSHLLEKLNISIDAPFSSAVSKDMQRHSCTPGTRVAILQKLLNWATVHGPGRKGVLFWLYGLAGDGKTTILHDICETLHEKKLLASSYFCSLKLTSWDSIYLVPTIAKHLASCSKAFGSALASQLRQDESLAWAELETQFLRLLCDPWRKAAESETNFSFTAKVVVIDALDECDRGEKFLDLLLDAINEGRLEGLRFIVASRPNPRFLSKVRAKQPDVAQVALREVSMEEANGDIRRYLETKLDISPSRIDELVAQADGLFIYASTIVKYLSPSNPLATSELERRFKKLISREVELGDIKSIYREIVGSALFLDDEDDMKGRLAILHAIICAAEPPSASVIAGLLNVELGLVAAVVSSLYSVLFTAGGDGPIFFHASFHDFIISDAAGVFQCHPPPIHSTFAHACLTEMTASLRFNICRLESSFISLEDLMPPIEKRIAEHIGDSLAYACRNWWVHIERCDETGRARVVPGMQPLLREKGIFWIETMILLGDIQRCKEILAQLTSPLSIARPVPTLRTLARDASNLVSRFEALSEKLTSHLYLSCLALSEKIPDLDCWRTQFKYLPRVISQQIGGRRYCQVDVPVKSVVHSVTFSPDGGRIASGSDDETVHIWDSESGRKLRQLKGHTGPIRSVAFSPNAMRIISGSDDKTIRVWNYESGTEIRKLHGHTDLIRTISFAPNGLHIASGSDDETIRVWESESGNELRQLNGHAGYILSLAFSPHGVRIVSGSGDKTIRIWDFESGKELLKLSGHTDWVNSVAFSPDGMRVVSGSDDETIRTWDAWSGKELQQLNKHEGYVLSVAFSHNGMLIVSGSLDKTIRVWDSDSGMELQRLDGHEDWVNSVAFSPRRMRIVSGSDDETIRIWNFESDKELQPLSGHTAYIRSVTFSPNGMSIVSSSEDNDIGVWDSESGKELQRLKGHSEWVACVAFSPDGMRIVSGSDDKSVRIWDIGSGNELLRINGHTGYILSVAFSPDGKRVVSGSVDTTVRIWHANSGLELRRLKGHTDSIESVAFSPDGMCIVSGSLDTTIRIWDAESGREIRKLQGHIASIRTVAFSPDGMRIVSGSLQNGVRIWDSESGREILRLNNLTAYTPSVAFSPDGMCIASGSGSGDKTIRIWDSESGKELRKLIGHTKSIRSVAFSPDGMRMVSGSDDKTIRVWDSQLDEMLSNPGDHANDVLSVFFRRDSHRLAPAGYGPDSESSIAPYCVSQTSVEPVTRFSHPLSSSQSNLLPEALAPNPHAHSSQPVHSVILRQTGPALSCRDDGWLVTSKEYTGTEKKILWIPPSLRPFDPSVLLVISREGFNSIDLAGCVFGKGWEQCYTGSL